MLGFGRVAMRQAREALRSGRLEEAQRLLCQPDAQGHKGSWELMQQVARGYLQRAERHLRHEDVTAAWDDLIQAEQAGGGDAAAALRQTMTRRALSEIHACLEAGEPARAVSLVEQLRARSVRAPALEMLEQGGKAWVAARDLGAKGEFGPALEAVKRAADAIPNAAAALAACRAELEARGRRFEELVGELHEAVGRAQWRQALQAAERVLAVAPQHVEARKARARAWKSVEPPTAAGPMPVSVSERATAAVERSRRLLLWVDGVGGYLVCLGARATLGQATPDGYVDVPLLADVSRLHAALTRDAEGYLLEAVRPTLVNGKPVEKALLRPGDRITLGGSCQVRFRQPVPVSATAELELESSHRLPLALDKVILMADTLVLGPTAQAHVVVPELAQPVVLFRQKDGLGVRCAGAFSIDGQPCRDRGVLGESSRVSGEDFAFAVEPVGTRMGRGG